MFRKYLNPRDYWISLAEANKYKYGQLKKVLLNDRGAIGIVAALIIGINMAAVFSETQAIGRHSDLSSARVLIHTISGMSALVSLWLTTQQYLKINMLTPYSAYHYKLDMRWFDEPIGYLVASLLTLPAAFVCGVFLSYSRNTSWLVACIVAGFLLLAITLVTRSALKYHKAISIREESREGTLPHT